ncbi:MAG: exodeoxyribonuclease VII large subunit [Thermodesulfobacteriota bacterium]
MSTVYSVTSLTRELKNLIEGKYRFIQVQGEISNLKRPYSGHAYFTLKDDGAQLRGVLFKGQARYLEKPLADGQQVTCHGRISIYEPRGDYQLIVDNVTFEGSGALQLQFEKLKKQLTAEGLFDSENKKNLPAFPKEIVLLTSPSGAAVHDFLKIWRRRGFPCRISIFPVPVQGEGAAKEIGRALDMVNQDLPNADCVVLCRGGGSLEDLWAFNEELLARSINESTLPVVSAVGHEIDFTISDFCADLRAPTPTAAAEMIIPDRREITAQLNRLQDRLTTALQGKIDQAQLRVDHNRRLLGDMNFLFTNISLRLDHSANTLIHIMERRLGHEQRRCAELHSRLQHNSPVTRLLMQEQRLGFVTEKLCKQVRKNLEERGERLGRQVALLDAVSPLATMARGYAIACKVEEKSGRKTLLKDSSQVQKDDQLELRLHKGKVDCRVV